MTLVDQVGVEMTAPEVRRALLPPFNNNCFVLVCPNTGASLIVDLPSSPEAILELAAGTQVQLLLVTHRHTDHWGALDAVKAATGAPVAVHAMDAPGIPVPADRLLADGAEMAVGEMRLRVIHTPGHTAGCVCLYTPGHLISGDALFPNGPGRTQSPADLDTSIASITTKLFPLPDATVVYPGHGDFTDLGTEKRRYAAFAARPRDPALCGDVSWV